MASQRAALRALAAALCMVALAGVLSVLCPASFAALSPAVLRRVAPR
jgi:hypothetical protein